MPEVRVCQARSGGSKSINYNIKPGRNEVAYVLELRRSCTLLCGVQYLCSGFFCQVSVLNSTIGDDSWVKFTEVRKVKNGMKKKNSRLAYQQTC